MKKNGTLVLVVSYSDVLSIVHWHKAVGLLCTNKAEVVEEGSKPLRSQSLDWKIPEVIRVTKKVPFRILRPQFSRRTVLERDKYSCQYCGYAPKNERELQIDHVLPRAQGGISTYINCVAACEPCNSQKRNRTPEQAGMILISAPRDLKAMTLAARLKMSARRKIKESWQKWINYYS